MPTFGYPDTSEKFQDNLDFHSSAELSKIGINYQNILQTVPLQKFLVRD